MKPLRCQLTTVSILGPATTLQLEVRDRHLLDHALGVISALWIVAHGSGILDLHQDFLFLLTSRTLKLVDGHDSPLQYITRLCMNRAWVREDIHGVIVAIHCPKCQSTNVQILREKNPTWYANAGDLCFSCMMCGKRLYGKDVTDLLAISQAPTSRTQRYNMPLTSAQRALLDDTKALAVEATNRAKNALSVVQKRKGVLANLIRAEAHDILQEADALQLWSQERVQKARTLFAQYPSKLEERLTALANTDDQPAIDAGDIQAPKKSRPAPTVPANPDHLDSLKRDALRAIAKTLNIRGWGHMTPDKLRETIRTHQRASSPL